MDLAIPTRCRAREECIPGATVGVLVVDEDDHAISHRLPPGRKIPANPVPKHRRAGSSASSIRARTPVLSTRNPWWGEYHGEQAFGNSWLQQRSDLPHRPDVVSLPGYHRRGCQAPIAIGERLVGSGEVVTRVNSTAGLPNPLGHHEADHGGRIVTGCVRGSDFTATSRLATGPAACQSPRGDLMGTFMRRRRRPLRRAPLRYWSSRFLPHVAESARDGPSWHRRTETRFGRCDCDVTSRYQRRPPAPRSSAWIRREWRRTSSGEHP